MPRGTISVCAEVVARALCQSIVYAGSSKMECRASERQHSTSNCWRFIGGVRQTLRLSRYRGLKNVALAFYPFNWQDASAAQLISYQAQRPRVLASNSEIWRLQWIPL